MDFLLLWQQSHTLEAMATLETSLASVTLVVPAGQQGETAAMLGLGALGAGEDRLGKVLEGRGQGHLVEGSRCVENRWRKSGVSAARTSTLQGDVRGGHSASSCTNALLSTAIPAGSASKAIVKSITED